jgi:hypothetical protein
MQVLPSLSKWLARSTCCAWGAACLPQCSIPANLLYSFLIAGAAAPVKLAGQISMLRKAWESSARVTKDDWSEWMRHFSVELLAQSPSPALRACHSLAQVRVHSGAVA